MIEFNFEPSPLVKAMEKRYCFDIEANGLLRDVSLFFCAVVQDVDTGSIWYYDPDSWQDFLDKLSEAHWLIGHNIIGYDLPALEKLYGWKPSKKTVIRDTLIMSRMYDPNLSMHPDCPKKVWSEHKQDYKTVGPHSLMNLGYIVGEHKDAFGEEKAFDEYCPEMLDYCAQDVKVNVKIFHWLAKKTKAWSTLSIECEMSTAAIIGKQTFDGWMFAIEKADALHNTLLKEMGRLEDKVHETFQPMYVPKTMVKNINGESVAKVVQPKVTKDGSLSAVSIRNIFGPFFQDFVLDPEYHYDKEGVIHYTTGAMTPIKVEEFNLGSRQQIAERLVSLGWTPTHYTDKGSIVINDSTLADAAKAGYAEAELLARYFLVSKRYAMVKGWIDAFNWDTGRIHGYVNSVGAVTSRMTHSNPNVAQVPAAKFDKETGEPIMGAKGDWGSDCRDLFTVPEGYTLVGCDASGLELRCLAHYMNDLEYTELILHGDIHSHNQELAGLPTRNNAKTFIYAFLYGAGDAKIGSIVGGGSKEGKKLKNKFLKGLPKLKKLLDNLKSVVEGRGMRGTATLKGLDGRRVRIRSAHAALNTLLQSCGAIVCKYWLIGVVKQCEKEGLDVTPVGNVHDEIQLQVKDKHVERVKEICEKMMPLVGDFLGFRCRLDAEAASGPSWLYTH